MNNQPKKKSGIFTGILVLMIMGAIIYGLQYFWHILDRPIQYCNQYLNAANGVFFKEMVWGVSAGTLLFIGILIVFPILMRNINTRSYFKNLYMGILSSLIFYLSQTVYDFIAKINKSYLLVSIAIVSVVTLILTGIIVKVYKKKEDQVEFRTSLVASITAGLIFGVLLQLVMIGLDFVKLSILNLHIKL